MKTELCLIMEKEGSDKSGNWHNYTETYFELFKKIKNDKLNIFELGIGTINPNFPCSMGKNGTPGASLRGWKNFFINSNIYGADIDKDILFSEDRIETYYCDQLDKDSIKNLFQNELKNIKYDVIIDDAYHIFEANKTFLLNSFEFLKEGGYYIIEDLMELTSEQFESQKKYICDELKIEDFNIITIKHERNNVDNQLLIIKK